MRIGVTHWCYTFLYFVLRNFGIELHFCLYSNFSTAINIVDKTRFMKFCMAMSASNTNVTKHVSLVRIALLHSLQFSKPVGRRSLKPAVFSCALDRIWAQCLPGFFLELKRSGRELTTHLLTVPKLRMSGTIFHLYFFMTWKKNYSPQWIINKLRNKNNYIED